MTQLRQCPLSVPIDTLRAAQLQKTLVSVVVPCFNEVAGIGQLKLRLMGFADDNSSKFDFEFLLVDDGSTDDTFPLLQSAFAGDRRFSVIHRVPNRGLTAAILAGCQQAKGEWIVSIDSDCTYDPRQIHSLLQGAEQGTDMIIGSPYNRNGKVVNVPGWRLKISKVANRIYRGLFRTKLSCYTSCFRAIRSSMANRVVVSNDGYVGMPQMIWRIEKLGGSVIEIPAVLDIRRYGQSKLSLTRVIVQHLSFMARVLFRGN